MNVFAIVIGNDLYPVPDKLSNAVADATAMNDVFVRLGYDTIPFYNFTRADIPSIMEVIENGLSKHDASIFYYAGHGFQVDGENYLPATDCQISYANKYQLRQESILLSELMNLYRPHSKKTNIVILDACRVRPSCRGGGDSFAPIESPQGTLIAFSTAPNSTAKDGGPDGHGLYTAALLSYIGRERISVEHLFKKVRRTVVEWSDNSQIPWEHTSLIGDFSFNTGQMVVSPQLPYNPKVIKDAEFDDRGQIAAMIEEIRSCDFNRQNPAIDKIWAMPAAELDKNQQFLFGRNLLQSSTASFSAQRFMISLYSNLRKYQMKDGDNHVLNGMLFEIYFDSHGEFRGTNLKRHYFEEVLSLRKKPEYENSFVFIRAVLAPYRDSLVYMIPEDDSIVDVDVTAKNQVRTNVIGEEETISVIYNVSVNGKDFTKAVRKEFQWYYGISLLDVMAKMTGAPTDVVAIHPNVPLSNKIEFEMTDDSFEG